MGRRVVAAVASIQCSTRTVPVVKLLVGLLLAGINFPMVSADGLTGTFYSGVDTTAAQTAFPTFSTYLTYFEGLTPDINTLTSSGGVTLLEFPGAGPVFGAYGFNYANSFASRMVGQISIASAGLYTFGTTSDDGSVLYIDNVLIVNNDFFQGATRRFGTAVLTAGLHAIDIGYFQDGGGNSLTIDWDGPGISGPTFLPNNVLTPIPEPDTSAVAVGFLLGAFILGRRCARTCYALGKT